MGYQQLRDDQWAIIEPFVFGGCKGKRGPCSNARNVINALLWLARSGARWRDIPERYGKFHTTKMRYYRWLEVGIIDQIFEALVKEADMAWLQIDSTVIKVHKHAAGTPLKKGAKHPKVWAALVAGSQRNSTP